MAKLTEAAHKTRWIAVKNLSIVWAQSQGELNQRHVDKIVAEFDPDMFDELVVTLPNGQGIYHIVDGQHRKLAIQQLYGDNEMVPCRVVDAKDPARAAMIFDKINTGRRQRSAYEKFRVRVTAGGEAEVAINKVVTWLGYKIEGSRGKHCIRAVTSLMNVYKTYGIDVLKETLITIKGTWADDENATEGQIIEGFAALIGKHRGHIDYPRLRQVTAKSLTPGRLLAQGKADKEVQGGRIADGVRRVLTRSYDQGLRLGKLEPEKVK